MNSTENNNIVDFNFTLRSSLDTHEEYTQACYSASTLPQKPEDCKICVLIFSQHASMPPRYYIASTSSEDTLTSQLELQPDQELLFGTVVQETYSAWRPFSHIGGGSFETDWETMCKQRATEKEGKIYVAWIVNKSLTRKKPLEIYVDRYQRWGYALVVSAKFTHQQKMQHAKNAFGDRYTFEWQMGNGKEVLVVTNPDIDHDVLWTCPANSDYFRNPEVLTYSKYADYRCVVSGFIHDALMCFHKDVTAVHCSLPIGSLRMVDKIFIRRSENEEMYYNDDLLARLILHGSWLGDRENVDKLIALTRLNWESWTQSPQPRNIKVLRYNRMLVVLSELERALPSYYNVSYKLQKMPGVTLRSEQRDVLTEMMRRETDPKTSYESQLFVKVAESGDNLQGLYYSPITTSSVSYWSSQKRLLALGPSTIVPRKFGGVLIADLGWGKTVLTFALIAHSSRICPTLVVVPTHVMLSQWKTMCDSMTTLKSYMYNKKYNACPGDMPEDVDVVFTTYALMKKDEYLQTNPWGRVIYDEVHELQKNAAPWPLKCDVVWGLTATLASEDNPSIFNIVSSLAGFRIENEEMYLKLFAIKAPPSSQAPSWTITKTDVNIVLPERLQETHTQLEFELLAKDWPLEDKLAVNRLHKVAAGFFNVNVPYRRRLVDLLHDGESSKSSNYRKRKMPDRLFEETECPICMDSPTQPVALVCGHSFCHACISTWLRHTSRKCPICREVCGGHTFDVDIVKTSLEHPTALVKEEDGADVHEFRVDKTMELIGTLGPTEKIIIFSHYNAILHRLKRRLKSERIHHVDMQHQHDSKTMASHLSLFDTDPECRVMLLNVRTQSAGLNLTAANNVLFMERPLDSTWYTQGVGRVARSGQTKDVSVHVLVSTVGF